MPQKRARELLFIVASFLLLFSMASSKPVFAGAAAGIMIPLYTYPGPTWDQTISVKLDHPSVPVAAIVNPSNGPGGSKDANYDSRIRDLRQAGVIVLGYVSTAYTARSLDAVKADIDRWDSWYDIDGIFFDEQTNWVGGEWYYDQADTYAKGKGYTMTVGNPGANSIPSYLDTVDVVLIYESPGLPNLDNYAGWSSYSNSKLGMIPFGVDSMPSQWIEDASEIVGWIYVTDDRLPNPWDSLPPYLDELATALDDGQPTPTHTITVNSVDQNGDSIDGMWMEVKKGSVTAFTGYTPITLSLESSTYTITAADYQQIIFDHWFDGSESSSRSLALTEDTAITAHYQNGDIPEFELTINAEDQNGNPINGMWTQIDGLQSGFTPMRHMSASGSMHIVTVADYQNFVFHHWKDTGAQARDRQVELQQDTELYAVYQDTSIPDLPQEPELPPEEPEENGNTFTLTQEGSARITKTTKSFARGNYDTLLVITGEYRLEGKKVIFEELEGALTLTDKDGNETAVNLDIEKFSHSRTYIYYRAEPDGDGSQYLTGRLKVGSLADLEDKQVRNGYLNAKVDGSKFSAKRLQSLLDFT